MSVDRTVIVGQGIILDLSFLRGPQTKVPSCEHPERQGQKFCPVCGVMVGTTTSRDDKRFDAAYARLTDAESVYDRNEFFSSPIGWESPRWFIGWGLRFDPKERRYEKKVDLISDIPVMSEIVAYIQEVLGFLHAEEPAIHPDVAIGGDEQQSPYGLQVGVWTF